MYGNKEISVEKLRKVAEQYRICAKQHNYAKDEKDMAEISADCNFVADALTELADFKEGKDIWRIGWEIPNTKDELVKEIENLGDKFQKMWEDAVKSGEAPNEDVSPAEGLWLIAHRMKKCDALEKVVKPILDCDVIFHKGEEVWSSGLMEREVRNGKNEVVATTFTPDCATGIKSCHNAVLEAQETAKAEGLIEECKGKRID